MELLPTTLTCYVLPLCARITYQLSLLTNNSMNRQFGVYTMNDAGSEWVQLLVTCKGPKTKRAFPLLDDDDLYMLSHFEQTDKNTYYSGLDVFFMSPSTLELSVTLSLEFWMQNGCKLRCSHLSQPKKAGGVLEDRLTHHM